ncbi:MAG: alpha/beta hydrolase [Verrucomicrobiota bacterium]
MFVVTNREILEGRKDLKQVGHRPNSKGANELRLLRADKIRGEWKVEVLADKMDAKMKAEARDLRAKFKMGRSVLPPPFSSYSGEYVALKTLDNIRRKKRDFLIFVHGFNNDLEAVLERARKLSTTYRLEVIPFSWPANGGGVKGVASYKSDKRDARTSAGALDRVLEFVGKYVTAFNEHSNESIAKEVKADAQLRVNLEERDEYVTRRMDEACPFRVNLLLHSMGNYLYKHLLLSDVYHARGLLFDNVVMAAADVNNDGHDGWVERIQSRNRIYVTINEDDSALKVSRAKSGQEQKARLGHYLSNLRARNVTYVNFTNASQVGNSHAYFSDDSLKNVKVRRFFRQALRGDMAEGTLNYESAKGCFHVS